MRVFTIENNNDIEGKSVDCKISNLMELFNSIEEELQESIDLRQIISY